MKFQLNELNTQNQAYINIYQDDKHIGNLAIHWFRYDNQHQLKTLLHDQNRCAQVACNIAAKYSQAPAVIAYISIIELDENARGQKYGTRILEQVPQIMQQLQLPRPDILCAYILPNYHVLSLQTYQHKSITRIAHRKMRTIMHKTFQRAGFYMPSILHPSVVIKLLSPQ